MPSDQADPELTDADRAALDRLGPDLVPRLIAQYERNLAVRLHWFGDDGTCFAPDGTERRERIARAVCDWICSEGGDVHDLLTAPGFGHGWARFWDGRHGQPWQPHIEAAVAAHIEPAAAYHSDPAAFVALLEAVVDAGWIVDFGENDDSPPTGLHECEIGGLQDGKLRTGHGIGRPMQALADAAYEATKTASVAGD